MEKGYRRGQVKNAPLVYVFAMIRIQEIKSYSKFIGSVQEALRDVLPNSYDQESNDRNINVNQDGSFSTTSTTTMNYYLSNAENTNGVMVKDDRIVLHSCDYTRFKDFREHFEPVVEKIKEVMNIDYYRGVGIRYVDHIKKIGDVDVRDIVKESFLPTSFGVDSGDSKAQSQVEIFNLTEHGNLIVRGTFLEKQPPVHPAILSSYTVLRGNDPVEKTLVLDTDHAEIEMRKLKRFDVSEVFDKLDDMHEVCHNVFAEVVNIDALEGAESND